LLDPSAMGAEAALTPLRHRAKLRGGAPQPDDGPFHERQGASGIRDVGPLCRDRSRLGARRW
jgi:hypothetical protein